jgi:signal transduction histidine kinase/CheY-like chemotaxis protein
MRHFFKRLPLPAKLGLIGLIPALALIYLAIALQYEKNEKLTILAKLRTQTTQSAGINQLIDDLQMERRLSFGYILNKKGESNMVMQRSKTDEALKAIDPTSGSRLEHFESFTLLDRLAGIRERISDTQISPREVMDYYSNTIFRLNNLAPVFTADISYLDPVVHDLRGQRALSEMVTHLGVIRANIYYAIYTNEAPEALASQINSSWDMYKTFETEFRLKASKEAIAEYDGILKHTALAPTLQLVEQTIQSGRLRTNYNEETWWKVSANGVDELKVLQRKLLGRVQTNVNDIYERELSLKTRNLVFLMLIIAIVVFITYYTIKTISDSLTSLKLAAQRLALGETGMDLDIHSRDVIGSLSGSIMAIDVNSNKLARAAKSIGEGQFDIDIAPRSKEDLLGNAVVKMREDLREFTAANEEKIWVQEGLASISSSVMGEKDLSSISNDILNVIVPYLGAEFGVLYASADRTLEYKGGYAVSPQHKIPLHLNFGETLAGQAALTRQLMVIDIPQEDYIKISSSLGSGKPRSLLILPLIHNDIVEGVIEIASLREQDQKSIRLLTEAAPGIAIALQSSKSRTRLQELLEETQSQSEELQSQHTELENINAELETQTEKLQASEEELRVQQEELQQANQELEERTRLLEERNLEIVERTREVQRKAKELEQSTKYKSEFLANMSHELRTPLNSILLLSRLLKENNDNNLNKEQIEYAQVIQSSGNGLLTLIDEILDLSKIEAGKMKLEYETVAVSDITEEMRSLFEPMAQQKKLEFKIDIQSGAPAIIETDKLRLGQVLKNLLSNSMKFTTKGAVTMAVKNCDTESNLICFTVKDTGIGIPEDKQEHIFGAFQQADGSTRRKFGGTGLGLSISREIVRLLGGTISLKSEAGEGSEFTVQLPKSKDFIADEEKTPEPAIENESVQPAQHTNGQSEKYISTLIPESIPDDRLSIKQGDKSILIVEDDTNFAKSLLEYTRKKGYKGIVSVRGDEGITLAREFRPTGVLLDIQLPVKSGWQVMEELKKDPLTRHIPVHMMSSYPAKRESLMKGAIDFINKPVAFEQMQQVFRKLEDVLNKDPKKVLIVEENSKHAKALSYFLETFDVNTEVKSSISDSINALKSEADCVILDMGVPDQMAYDMLEGVKNTPGLENLPIIIFTGKSLSLAEEKKIRQYADSIVVKTAHSYQRILDEVSLFLHLVEENNKPVQKSGYKKLGALNDVLQDKMVLIVDDDVRNIFSLTKALERLNMKIITAVDGKEALEKMKEHPGIDMVLLDMMMPEMDGYETARKIRENPAWKNLPVIAVTAKAMTGDRNKCIAAGASDYITKPIDIDQLLSLLRVWLYERV